MNKEKTSKLIKLVTKEFCKTMSHRQYEWKSAESENRSITIFSDKVKLDLRRILRKITKEIA